MVCAGAPLDQRGECKESRQRPLGVIEALRSGRGGPCAACHRSSRIFRHQRESGDLYRLGPSFAAIMDTRRLRAPGGKLAVLTTCALSIQRIVVAALCDGHRVSGTVGRARSGCPPERRFNRNHPPARRRSVARTGGRDAGGSAASARRTNCRAAGAPATGLPSSPGVRSCGMPGRLDPRASR